MMNQLDQESNPPIQVLYKLSGASDQTRLNITYQLKIGFVNRLTSDIAMKHMDCNFQV